MIFWEIQQNAVGADDAGFVNLEGIHDEILAQHRQAARSPGLLQVIDAALKKLLIREHRQAGRTGFSVGLGDIGGNEVGAQHASGRAGLFDLRNHGRLAAGNSGAQRTGEVARQHAGLGVRAHGRQGLARDRSGDFFALDGDDLVQDVRHGFQVAASGGQFLGD